MKKLVGWTLLVCLLLSPMGCSFTKRATEFNGMTSPSGKINSHVNVTNIGLNLLITRPLAGDATLQGTVKTFTEAAKQDGTKVQIVQSSSKAWWFILPPISFIVTPVVGNVAGDVLP